MKEQALSAFIDLPLERKIALLQWIKDNLLARATMNSRHTSYGLKHLVVLPEEKDSYFTNDEFKGAMLVAGYQVDNSHELNWVFNISEKSPALTKR